MLPTSSNPLDEERKKASFNPREMFYLLSGGEKHALLREKFMLELERDPDFKVDDYPDLSRAEIRERTMRKARTVLHYLSNEPVEHFKRRMEVIGMITPDFWTRLGVHYGLFFGALQGQATPEQFSYWVERGALALNGMVGCFSMTELGHGSNVAGLETTATFDESTDEFVIHTPTLTATKWWIGGAAQTATHTVVYARLIVKGKDHGVKTFVVQLRDPATFELMPGVNIGDIGAKMGRHGIDNGWIQFTHVRIPRSHMLMKHTKVSRFGKVSEPHMQQLAYGALIQGRVSMVVDSANTSQKALTIAIRYGAIRRQFSSDGKKEETKILDYPIHQHRLMPLLAFSYAMRFTGLELNRLYENLLQKMEQNEGQTEGLAEVIASLKETHATSAGLKAFCTWNCLHIIEQCRQACGGNGYSSYVGLAGMYQDFAVHCTWEGDNTILALQSGRYLVSCYQEAKAGKHLPPGVGYLNDLGSILRKKCTATTISDISHLPIIDEAWKVVSANTVQKAGAQFSSLVENGFPIDDAYEKCSQARLKAAKLHSYGYIFNMFKEGVNKANGNIREILVKLCQLYGLYFIQENAGDFLQCHYFTPSQMDMVTQRVNQLCGEVREQAIPLVDSFGLTDFIVNSPLGRYDGDVYKHYFDLVKKQNPQVPNPYFHSVLKPLIERSLDNGDKLILDEE